MSATTVYIPPGMAARIRNAKRVDPTFNVSQLVQKFLDEELIKYDDAEYVCPFCGQLRAHA